MRNYFTLDQNDWPQRYRYLLGTGHQPALRPSARWYTPTTSLLSIEHCECGTVFEAVYLWQEPKPQLGNWLRWLPIVQLAFDNFQ